MARERKTLAQMAAEAAGGEKPLAIAGKPADQCPYCGAGMFKDGVNARPTIIFRYVECRVCKRRFLSKQPPATIVREVGGKEDISDEVSAGGILRMPEHRETA